MYVDHALYLYGLTKQEFKFELKGSTSLSKIFRATHASMIPTIRSKNCIVF